MNHEARTNRKRERTMKNHMRTTAWTALGIVALLVLAVSPVLSAPAAWYSPNDSGRSSLYRSGQEALDARRWAEAAEIFDDVAKAGGQDADAAFYWQGYALEKRGQDRLALEALAELQKRYPDSRWIDDARALDLEIRQSSGETVAPGTLEDDELKLYAVSSLMNVNSDRAVPILEKILASDQSIELKDRALFVLSMSDTPRARQILLETAQGSSSELAEKAIDYLGLCDECGPELRQIYAEADVPVRHAILNAMMVADDNVGLLEAAENETDPGLRAAAIDLLGVQEAVTELRRLYEKESSHEIREQIVEALFLADDASTLAKIAETDPDPRMRRKAIESLGLVGTEESRRALDALYANESSTEVKEAIVDALFLSEGASSLAKIARNDPDPELRRKAISNLGLIDTSEGGRQLEALYGEAGDTATKETILDAFFIQDNHEALIEIFRSEQDPELRKKALENLSMIDSDEAVDYLLREIEK